MLYEKKGIFYLLPSQKVINNKYNFLENFVCTLIQSQWRLNKSILIACENKSQAIRIDKVLWDYDNNTFLPHNLFNKNNHKVPIVIFWPQCCYDHLKRDLLINLMQKYMNFFFNFNEIYDFVPTNHILKQYARIRYKFYKSIGFNISIIDNYHVINH